MKITIQSEPEDIEAFFGVMKRMGFLEPDFLAKATAANLKTLAENPESMQRATTIFGAVAKGVLEAVVADPKLAGKLVEFQSAAMTSAMQGAFSGFKLPTGTGSTDAASLVTAPMEMAKQFWAPWWAMAAAMRPAGVPGETAKPARDVA